MLQFDKPKLGNPSFNDTVSANETVRLKRNWDKWGPFSLVPNWLFQYKWFIISYVYMVAICKLWRVLNREKMSSASSRGFQVLACSGTSSFNGKKIHKTSFSATCLPAPRGHAPRHLITSIRAQERPTWLPGLDSPPYLDGTLPGDYGFDPLGLGEDPESLRWYVQAELVHARFAMAGVAGILLTDLLRVTGVSDLPVWYEAGTTKFNFASTRTLFIVQLLLMGFVETKRLMDFNSPGSQAKEGSFFGLEASLEGLEPGYPGGPLFNPLGLAKTAEDAEEWKLKEIKNGRLAMVAMLGFIVQASVTHAGPVNNLMEHLSNPWHKTIIQTLAKSGP